MVQYLIAKKSNCRSDRFCWRAHRLQSFVDLGCGNGLLTHLLVSEGHPGKGIDIAKRKIWDQLCNGKDDCLIGKCLFWTFIILQKDSNSMSSLVQSLHPPTASYPNVDWLIANHADELVPWWVTVLICSREKDCGSDVTHVRGEHRTPIMAARTESR